MVSDWLMGAAALVAAGAAVRYGIRKHSYIAGMWALPLAEMGAYYVMLAVNWKVGDLHWRHSLYRYGQFTLLVLVSVYLLNGHVNRSIDRVVSWCVRLKRRVWTTLRNS